MGTSDGRTVSSGDCDWFGSKTTVCCCAATSSACSFCVAFARSCCCAYRARFRCWYTFNLSLVLACEVASALARRWPHSRWASAVVLSTSCRLVAPSVAASPVDPAVSVPPLDVVLEQGSVVAPDPCPLVVVGSLVAGAGSGKSAACSRRGEMVVVGTPVADGACSGLATRPQEDNISESSAASAFGVHGAGWEA